ncbi:hypothetical protein AGMMS50268_13730 [Spirochaetia bacterium]|nr:hypothetical protein AGMMS50268_13730 [Spirochaetia bacterium]
MIKRRNFFKKLLDKKGCSSVSFSPPPPPLGLKLRFLIAFIAALALAGCFSSVFEPNYTLGIKGKNTTGDPKTIGGTPENPGTSGSGGYTGPVPTTLWAVPGDTLVKLSWAELSNSEFAGVDITWTPADGTPAQGQFARGTAQPLIISGLTNDTAYTFTAKTVDTFGNQSEGVSVTVTPTAGILPDTTAPAEVSNLQAAAGNTEVVLTWTDPADSDFAKAVITWTPAGGVTQPVDVVKGIQTATISGLTNDTLYTFTVKTVDTSVNISAGVSVTATPTAPFVAVTGISRVQFRVVKGKSLTLYGAVAPANATNKAITWAITGGSGASSSGAAGATLTGNAVGTVTVRATIADGLAPGSNYTQDFIIDVVEIAETTYNVTGVGAIEMVSIPATVTPYPMGDPYISNASPLHSVSLSAFKMMKYEVTQAQFKAVMGYNGNSNSIIDYGTGPTIPAYHRGWYEALIFCNRLSIAAGLEPVYSVKVGGVEVNWATVNHPVYVYGQNADWNAATMDRSKSGYRLPTEAEWEYACRAGTATNYYTGEEFDAALQAVVFSGYDFMYGPVGQKLPNAFGLHDMNGNASEWCWDWYGPYNTGAQTDPTGPVNGTHRVYHRQRSADRDKNAPWELAGLGLRLVRN